MADPASVVPLWRAVRQCYPTEAAAVEAVRVNPALCLPWVCSVNKIQGSYKVLVELCGKEAALEVITKNPGALGNDPVRLRSSSASEIMAVATLAATLGAVRVPLAALAAISLVVVTVAPDAEALGTLARPAIGAIGAGSFFAAAGLAGYAGSRRPQ